MIYSLLEVNEIYELLRNNGKDEKIIKFRISFSTIVTTLHRSNWNR